jgi:hypothetical protein
MSRVNRQRAKQNPSIASGTLGATTGDAARREHGASMVRALINSGLVLPALVVLVHGIAFFFLDKGTWACFGF